MLLHELFHLSDELMHPVLSVLQLIPQTLVLPLEWLQWLLELLSFLEYLRDTLLIIYDTGSILLDDVIDLLTELLLSRLHGINSLLERPEISFKLGYRCLFGKDKLLFIFFLLLLLDLLILEILEFFKVNIFLGFDYFRDSSLWFPLRES